MKRALALIQELNRLHRVAGIVEAWAPDGAGAQAANELRHRADDLLHNAAATRP